MCLHAILFLYSWYTMVWLYLHKIHALPSQGLHGEIRSSQATYDTFNTRREARKHYWIRSPHLLPEVLVDVVAEQGGVAAHVAVAVLQAKLTSTTKDK